VRTLSPSTRLACGLALSLAGACTPHEDAPKAKVPHAAPPVVREAEPEIPPPPVVAPPLPELAPSRPLAHLEVLWKQLDAAAPLPGSYWAIGESALALTQAEAEVLGLAGPPSDLEHLSSGLVPLSHAGPLLLLREHSSYFALERGTDGFRWQTPDELEARSYDYFIAPRVLVAEFYLSDHDELSAWALADGRHLWTRSGGVGVGFARVSQLWTDGTRGYMLNDVGLEAFDPNTGTKLWDHSLDGYACGASTGEGKLVLERSTGYHILDAELGTELGRIATPPDSLCAWRDYEPEGVAPGVIAGGRLYAFGTRSIYEGPRALHAYDLGERHELWQAEGFDYDRLVVDHDAVFVARNEDVLVALDAATGSPATELSIGTPFELAVEPAGGEAGPLVVVFDELGGRWVLGRSEAAPTFEDYVIRGQLDSTYLDPTALERARVRVGGELVEVDKRGRFVARGRARGAVGVRPPEPDYDALSTVTFDPRRIVLDGSGRYDLGKLEAWEMSME
jgi:hypothetical protein